ncbi:predicted protein [Nematostella vectensis]|uniref:Cholesterol 24-hydroxylase n=1 Tax=Nematostella vectensis TaxID=45351 RepID=A7SCY4_NEMVE|nr:cholesterol 24-hydroxylase [Nematostella vectensis]EDO38396.1 predicted protein [Nematostella vectensis]|eukprot:XP_001630459.1 predicted protein [Nematostella vectensis]
MSVLSCVLTALILLSVILLFALLIYALYILYVRRKYKEIPGPPVERFFSGHVPIFNQGRLRGLNFYQILWEISQEYSPVILLWYYHIPFVALCGHELTRQALLELDLPKAEQVYQSLKFVFGQRAARDGILTECDPEIWKRKRGMLSPAFHRLWFKDSMGMFNAVCDKFLVKLEGYASSGEAVDLSEMFSRVTMDVIGKVGFNNDLRATDNDKCEFRAAAYTCLKGMQENMQDVLWQFNVLKYPLHHKARHAAIFLREFAARVIAERRNALRKGETTPKDILAHILRMSDGDKPIADEEMIDNFLTLFIAGQETTANQLAFTVYEIGKHPQIEMRIQDEVERVLGGKSRVDYEDLNLLKYVNQTLKESLRLHPPISGLSRMTTKDITLNDVIIPKDTCVILSQFVTHRDPEVWNDPDTFDPERFALENVGRISSSMYFPFSLGPRSCIGNYLAQFEAKVIMARLYQQFKVVLVSGQKLAYEETVTTRPRGGVWCRVLKRNKDYVD